MFLLLLVEKPDWVKHGLYVHSLKKKVRADGLGFHGTVGYHSGCFHPKMTRISGREKMCVMGYISPNNQSVYLYHLKTVKKKSEGKYDRFPCSTLSDAFYCRYGFVH